MSKIIMQWLAAAVLSISAVGAANAVTVNYTGTVDNDIFLSDPTLAGTSFSGTVYYGYSVPPGPGNTYLGVITAADITLGGTTYAFTSPFFPGDIGITDNDPFVGDGFSVSLIDALGSFKFVDVVDNTGATFAGIAPTEFSFDFATSTGFLTLDAFGIVMNGTLTSLSAVPEPSIVALLGLGLIGVFVVRRKRRV